MVMERMVVEMRAIDIKVEVIEYIRVSGESVKDYNIGAIVDNLLECGYDNNTGDDRMDSLMMDMLGDAVYDGRIA